MRTHTSRRVIPGCRAWTALCLLSLLPAAAVGADGAVADLPSAVTPEVPAQAPEVVPLETAPDDESEPAEADLAPQPIQPGSEQAAAAEHDRESLVRLAEEDRAALGPLSIGTPDAGLLVNPLPMPEGPLWTIRNPAEAFATAETIEFLRTAIQAVADRFPGSPRVVIGDLSRPDGGRLNRHRSHQVGRDVDLGFYYRSGEASGFETARQSDLDPERTWALVRALLTETDVERIFLDRSLIRVLYAHALESGEDRSWLDDVFGRQGDDRKGIIQHVKRHKNHMHVRFFNRSAQERGRIVYPALVRQGSVPPPTIKHRVRRGETLGHLAGRYGVSISAIRAANGLRGSRLRAGRAYLIPVRRVPDLGPIVIPPRRLPPPSSAQLVAEPSGVAAGGEPTDTQR